MEPLIHAPLPFTRAELNEALTAGLVTARSHPSLPLAILNYTERAQWERIWTPVTRACRGLIVDAELTGVVARAFDKFFNHSEPEGACSDQQIGPCLVTEKLDGSLGIIYPGEGGQPAVATRGSFTSAQALWATEHLRTRYPDWRPDAGFTSLVEIIYPENRIVCDYGQMAELILLDEVETATGRSWGLGGASWPGRTVEDLTEATVTLASSVAEALALPPRPGREGVVLHWPSTGYRVKIKQEEYIRLHRVATSITPLAVWRAIRDGESRESLRAGVPDELYGRLREILGALDDAADRLSERVRSAHARLVEAGAGAWDDRAFALKVGELPVEVRPGLFLLRKGRPIDPWVWKQIRPTVAL